MTTLEAPWLTHPALQQLFALFEEAGATLRLVGGSVRDGLLGLPASDMDLAVNRPPEWVMDILKSHHIKVIPTGIDHGTVTAILEKKPYQITTLRVDIKTFGRRAHVAFTEDWTQDAERRDFTINALYADRDGQLFDPVGGLEDLQKRHVRFIGDPSQRIREDYLRILRFFRFSARFGHEPYDAEGLKACQAFASHLPHLARERVTDEFMKLLDLSYPLYTLQAMKDTGVLSYILHPGTWEDFQALMALEKRLEGPSPALVRLAAFHPDLAEIQAHLRLSKPQCTALTFLTKHHHPVTPGTFKHQAYRWGKERTFKVALLQMAQHVAATQLPLEDGTAFLRQLHDRFKSWIVPVFPLTGSDILAHGIKEGNRIGSLLKAVETWWIDSDFQPDRKGCLAYLTTLV